MYLGRIISLGFLIFAHLYKCKYKLLPKIFYNFIFLIDIFQFL